MSAAEHTTPSCRLRERLKELLANYDGRLQRGPPSALTDSQPLPVPLAPATWGDLRALLSESEGYHGIAHDLETMRAALERSVTALDDWLNTYASDMCDQKRVAEAHARIGEHGTLGYIADVQQQNRKALYGK